MAGAHCRGQRQREGAARALTAADTDAAAVRFDDVFDETQSQAIATDLRGSRFIAAIKRLKDVRQICGWNAKPVIAHGDLDRRLLALIDGPGLKTDPTAFTAVLHGVVEQ